MGLDLGASELELLVWEIPNELINGFDVHDFQSQIGIAEAEFRKLANQLREASRSARIELISREARSLHNALALTLDELGVEEFQTRTGFDFNIGREVLLKLDQFLEMKKD